LNPYAHILSLLEFQTDELDAHLTEAADFVAERLGRAQVALVLGSGLNEFVGELTTPMELSYALIPHMPTPTVKVHMKLQSFSSLI
jgi:purine nucleoside phosphorylase